jgi:hypothetical protein
LAAEKRALSELARRELIKRDLLEYVRYFWADQDLRFNWFHRELADYIMSAIKESQEQRKRIHLLISCPPRHSKSLFTTRGLTGWFLGNYPNKEILVANATSELSMVFGREIRKIINTDEYQAVFPQAAPTTDSNAVDHLNTLAGGGYYLGGAGVQWLGRGASLIICDDVVGSEQDAQSETEMNQKWLWFNSEVMSRRAPACVTIVMHQRMGPDDLIGKIKSTDKQGIWKHLNYPALATENELHRKIGDALQPEWISTEMLVAERERLIALHQERTWMTLYQQDPTPMAGVVFHGDWFKDLIVPEKSYPDFSGLTNCISIDLAVSDGRGDYTAIMPMSFDSNDICWVQPDCFHKQADPKESMEALARLLRRYDPTYFFVEKGPLWNSLKSTIERLFRECRCYPRIIDVSRGVRSKVEVATPYTNAVQHKLIRYPDNSFTRTVSIPQHLNFGSVSKSPDIVDALALPFVERGKIILPSEEITLPEPEDMDQATLQSNWIKEHLQKKDSDTDPDPYPLFAGDK